MLHVERFRAKLEVDPATSCWRWQASKRHGYGQFWDGGRNVQAHRWAYQQFVGLIPDGLQIDHLCRVRACVNPEHMEPVTSAENSLRSPLTLQSQHRARTQCPAGHPYEGENLYIYPNGNRECRECHRVRERSRYWARKAAG